MLLAPVDRSELLVLCWAALERLSRELQHPNTNPSLQTLPLLSLPPFWGSCVRFAFLLPAAEAKRDGKCQRKQFPPPPSKDECHRAYFIGPAFS